VGRSVTVVGAGDMGESLVTALHAKHRPAELVVVNRTPARARVLSEAAGGRAVGLGELPEALQGADAVIVSTGAAVPVLEAQLLRPIGAERPDRPLVVVDLGVPRNVEPSVRGAPGIALFDMDDLTAHAERALEGRRAELARARAVVAREIERFREDDRARGAAPVVAALRAKVEELRRTELERHRGRNRGLDEAQWDEVDAVVRDVLAKLMHQPTVALKDAVGTPRGERLVEALRTLFDL
jgi:glutamyl-tRNA reductase